MSVINTQPLIGASGNQGDTGYNLTKSLRFRRAGSGYLSRSPAGSSNRRTWTFSCWVKRGALDDDMLLMGIGSSNSSRTLLYIDGSYRLSFLNNITDGGYYGATATSLLRDTAAWYHLVIAVDTTQASSGNRVKLYVNGVQQSTTGDAIAQNAETYVNTTQAHNIGRSPAGQSTTNYFDGYMTEVNFIDGSQLTPSDFGETDAITGVWKPKEFTGTYGTNGFYLPFTDVATTSGSNAGLGKDFSGNGNYWNTNNISVTSGATYDSMTDVPTLTSASAANYAVLNPLSNQGNGTISGANLNYVSSAAAWKSAAGTMFMNSGQWYYECTVTNFSSSLMVGICNTSLTNFNDYAGDSANSWSVQGNASGTNKWNNNSSTSIAPGEATSTGDVFMVAFDVAAAKVWFGKNGTWYSSGDPAAGTNAAFTNLTGSIGAMISSVATSCTLAINFGQRGFLYTPPTGFKALNTYNLPDSTLVAGNKVMDATTWSGTNSTGAITISNLQFKPDLVWSKSRSNAFSNQLTDSVRGVNNTLISNSTAAQDTTNVSGAISSFNSNGFTATPGSSDNWYWNYNGGTFVGWAWQAGQGTTSSNTSGSITSTVSVNASAGFSIVTYTAPASSQANSFGHGLGVAPAFVIAKNRSSGTGGLGWAVYHQALGANQYLGLNSTAAAATYSGYWGSGMTSTVVGLPTSASSTGFDNCTGNMVAYCWSEVAGFSKFGSYVGNGSTDGTFVYTGFRPKFLLFKQSSAAGEYWHMMDSTRSPTNAIALDLYPNLSNAEATYSPAPVDFLSNGFKFRTDNGAWNGSGATYIYAAFAENPFKNSLAR